MQPPTEIHIRLEVSAEAAEAPAPDSAAPETAQAPAEAPPGRSDAQQKRLRQLNP
jgi:hypothetical protein